MREAIPLRPTVEELTIQLGELVREPERLARLSDLLEDVPAYDISEVLRALPSQEALAVLGALEPSQAAAVMEYLELIEQYRFLHHLPEQRAREILDQISSDLVADLIGAVHPRQAEQLLKLIPADYRAKIRTLVEYPENSAGGRMTIDYISVRHYMTAEEVLAHIRKVGHEADTISYVYVVDAAGRLMGVCSLREIILASPRERVSEIMTQNLISVPATMDQEEVARIVKQYDFVAIPVVAPDNRMLGVITVEAIIDVLEEEATEDVLRLGAAGAPADPEDGPFLAQVWAAARPRLPWLMILLFMEMGTGLIALAFARIVSPLLAAMLSLFTVVITGTSGNASSQALAIAVRGLATGEIHLKDIRRVVFKEACIGLVTGLICGATLALVAGYWHHSAQFGLAVGLALGINLVVAKILGGLFPLLIFKLGVDPAVASGPFITTLNDNTSVLIYYTVAALILHQLNG
jgi:magnesium transporter